MHKFFFFFALMVSMNKPCWIDIEKKNSGKCSVLLMLQYCKVLIEDGGEGWVAGIGRIVETWSTSVATEFEPRQGRPLYFWM
jgi:hypothetical protein